MYPIKFIVKYWDDNKTHTDTGFLFAKNLSEALRMLEDNYDNTIETVTVNYLDDDWGNPIVYCSEDIIDKIF